MKILFLHLSDIHIKSDTALDSVNPSAISRSLRVMGQFDNCIVIMSGDIAFSGMKEEYNCAISLLSFIKREIKDNYDISNIHFFIVPGNHDNFVRNRCRGLKEISDFHQSGKVDQYFQDDLVELENFYVFARKYGSFKNDKVFDVQKLKLGDIRFKFNLINTAPFSLISNSNDDKGIHHLPSREFSKFDFDINQEYTVSIMHHSPEWFWDDSKRLLYENLYRTSNLIFMGHEHFALGEQKIVNEKYHVVISNGVALSGTPTEHGFNAFILDINDKYIFGKKFVYVNGAYISSENLVDDKVIFRGKYNFTLTESFRNFLETDSDEFFGDEYLKYFVFPDLEVVDISDNNNLTFSSEQDFFSNWMDRKVFFIEGGSKAGKTLLSKYIFLYMLKDYVPIYLTNEDFTMKNNRRMIADAIWRQYGDQVKIDNFLQIDKNRRVLILDGKNFISKSRWDSFWKECQDYFDLFLILSNTDYVFDVKEKTIEELSGNKACYLRICPFYYKKRSELIKKICEYKTHLQGDNLGDKAKKINEDITNQVQYFLLNPYFIRQYVNCYLSFPLGSSTDNISVFNKVYEANVTMRIAEVAGEENVSDIMMSLEYIAYYAHFQKKYPFSRNDFQESVMNYNNDYDNNVNCKKTLDFALKAKILKEIDDNFDIIFYDDNLLAYFVAAHLHRLLISGNGQENLKYLLDNICFRPNGDIVLFLSYIANNFSIFTPIFSSLKSFMDSWEELSLDLKNISYIVENSIPTHIKEPTANDKKNLLDEKDHTEREIVKRHNSEHESLYEYNEAEVNSFANKVTKALNYLSIIAKMLPNFRSFLRGEQKKEIVSILYTYPNKLLYFMFRDIDNDYSKAIDDIINTHPKTKKGLSVTKEMVKNALKNQSLICMLSIYNLVAETASNSKTIVDLNKEEYFKLDNNSNYCIMNLMMEENAGDFSSFTKKAENFKKHASLDIVKRIISIIVRKYFLCHEIPLNYHSELQHVADTFFSKDQSKILQQHQRRKRLSGKK